MLPSHIWEFLLGSLLANIIFPKKKFKINYNRTFSEVLVFLFIVFDFLSFIFDNTKQHPSYFTLPIILSVFWNIIIFKKFKDLK